VLAQLLAYCCVHNSVHTFSVAAIVVLRLGLCCAAATAAAVTAAADAAVSGSEPPGVLLYTLLL
jgi:hypothetical protein